MKVLLLPFLVALVIAFIAIPTIIRISYLKHLYDVPDDRKAHGRIIPTLGGLAIFAGFTIALTIFAPDEIEFKTYKYILGALLIIFFIGLQDDILQISPLKKLMGQIVSASLVVLMGGIRITSMYGFLGIGELNDSASIILSIFTLLVIMNGFNLIDGINWLSGGVGIVVSAAFGAFFYVNGFEEYTIISSALIGGLLGFLWFNRTPAKIFMGDTGSLMLGLINGVLSILFIEKNAIAEAFSFEAVPIVAFGIMIVPLFDTLRVFIWRMLRGKSPLNPDRNHIHHRLLQIGFTHMKSSGIIILTNILFIAFLVLFHDQLNQLVLLTVMLAAAALLSYLPSLLIRKQRKEQKIKKKNVLSKVS